MTYKSLYTDGNILASAHPEYGGTNLHLSLNHEISKNLQWLANFKKEYENEEKLRQENFAVKKAWEQYQIIKILAKKETE